MARIRHHESNKCSPSHYCRLLVGLSCAPRLRFGRVWRVPENPMDQINKAIAPARLVLLIVAFALLCVAGAKYFGVSIPQVRGDWWQLIILALGIKSL